MGIFLWCTAGHLSAQEFHVDSIQKSTIHTVQAQLDAYASGFFHTSHPLYTATMNLPVKTYFHWQDVIVNAGLSTSIYSTNIDYLRFICSVGYKYIRYNYQGDFFSNAGIHSHWLASEWKMGLGNTWIGIEAGFGVDAKLHHKIIDHDHFRYVGFNDECLNKVSVAGLIGVYLPYKYCRCEFLVDLYIIPPLDAQKIAYYNIASTEVSQLTFEFRVYIPIFTTFSNNSTVKSQEKKL